RQQQSGCILGVSSIYGDFSRKNRLAYAASKHALNAMIKTMALELGGDNIRVNGIAPGFVDTQLTRKNNDQATIDGFKRKIPLGRLANA
ncbi:SDR family oxidoreductase, partial [Acinetobacter baumannii]